MKLKNSLKKVSIGFVIAVFTVQFAYASSDITKEYNFKANSPDELKYKYEKEITEGFKKYKEKSVTYQVIKDKRDIIKRSFEDNPPLEVTEKGEVYKRKEQSSKEKITSLVTYNRGENIPAEIEKDGEVLKLKDKNEKTIRENVSLPARFYGEPGASIYKFNGRYVSLANPNSPIWSTFNTDVRAYLNLGSDYQIQNGAFTGSYIQSGDTYYRDAVYSAIRTTPVVEASYESENKYTYIYAGKNKKVEARAIVVYELISDYTPVVIGAGGVILALAGAGIIFLLMKKRKKENENE